MGFSPTFGAQRFPKGEWKDLWCARRRKPPAAAGGIDAPTAARVVGLPPYGFSPASVPEGFQRASGKPFGAPAGAYPFPAGGNDAPTTAREQGLQPYGAFTLFFRWRKKSVQKKASGTATPEAAHVASHCGQALRYACAWLRASWPSAISGASRPSASLGGGLRSAGALRAVLDLGSLRSPAGKKPFIAHF